VTRGRGHRSAPPDAPPRETWLGRGTASPLLAPERLRVAVCYPAEYRIGMSNLGFQSALREFLAVPGVRCERAFAPPDRDRLGRSHETSSPLRDFDVVAFSVSFETDFLNLVAVLDAAGIPLSAEERGEGDAVVVMGGACAHLNPEPVAPFLDAVLVGGADRLVPDFTAAVLEEAGGRRGALLERLAGVAGVYVPSLWDAVRDDAGRVEGFTSCTGGLGRVAAREAESWSDSVVLSDRAYFADMHLIEVSRGCGRCCAFCATGHLFGGVRYRPADAVIESARRAAEHTSRIGLISTALGDHPDEKRLLRALIDLGLEINIPSLRAEAIDEELAELLVDGGVRTVTMAPEAGSADLRRAVGKRTDDRAFLEAAEILGGAGIDRLKLYLMVGLPGETDGDIDAAVELAAAVGAAFRKRGSGRVTVSASPFVPKPRTPLQWAPMESESVIRGRLAALRRGLARSGVAFSSAGPREARLEAALARGGREVAQALRLRAVDGVPWKAALRRAGVDSRALLDAERPLDEVFPWEVMAVGRRRAELRESYERARALFEGRSGSG